SGLMQMTSGAEGESTPRWSPDGRAIAFVARRGSAGSGSGAASGTGAAAEPSPAQIYLLSNSGGEAIVLTAHESAVENPIWSPDGKWIFYLASDAKTAEEKARERARDDVHVFDEEYKHRHLWKINVATKKEQRVTSGTFSVLGYSLSEDGSRVAIERAPTPLLGDTDQSEIWAL